ncbi:MAG: TIGR02206 family membrane protein [Peptococcaceae bacterium]|nr:TIGR02206 family membrane protein [Peptococcaceae bacterium]MDH7525951.1 TIGR02206 family membrane protein [Peptococcaceae bacterium]
MERYFSPGFEQPFITGSSSHLGALALIAAVNILLFAARRSLRGYRTGAIVRRVMAFTLLLLEASLQVWPLVNGFWSARYSLPLHLCDMAMFLSAAMLLTGNYSVYELAYFWGLGGASQALLTPDTAYAFPHFTFLVFFASHGLIITACLWMTFIENYRPRARSAAKAFAAANIYLLVMAVINSVLGSNYLYICQKPAGPSLLDYLGPWPWYILSLEAVGAVTFLLCYLPFAASDYYNFHKLRKTRRNRVRDLSA